MISLDFNRRKGLILIFRKGKNTVINGINKYIIKIQEEDFFFPCVMLEHYLDTFFFPYSSAFCLFLQVLTVTIENAINKKLFGLRHWS